ncbi:unnamed protein product [Ostreobium quekettii]|uniref:7,8-dihydroneopterin aldolase n=1 Tax=Ostreobium quekettii TaxID=121088 RepID=A0A8S1IY82_9CHLO|nr:unnamed protein product [Ostreobium quekettii]
MLRILQSVGRHVGGPESSRRLWSRAVEAASRNSTDGLDRIELRGLTFFGYHGVLPEEQKLGQRFIVDATLFCDLSAAAEHDSIDRTVDYSKAHRQIASIVEGEPVKLIESLADRIASALLSTQNELAAVEIRVIKPQVPIAGTLDSVGMLGAD